MNRAQISTILLFLIVNTVSGSFLFHKSSSKLASSHLTHVGSDNEGKISVKSRTTIALKSHAAAAVSSSVPVFTLQSSVPKVAASTTAHATLSLAATTAHITASSSIPVITLQNSPSQGMAVTSIHATISMVGTSSQSAESSTFSKITPSSTLDQENTDALTINQQASQSITTSSEHSSLTSSTTASSDIQDLEEFTTEGESLAINTESVESMTATDAVPSSSVNPDNLNEVDGGIFVGNQTSGSTAEISNEYASAILIEPDTSSLISQLKELETMGRPASSSLLKWAVGIVPDTSESEYIAYSKSLATMCDIIMNKYSTFGKCLSGNSRFKEFDSAFWYSSIKFLCYYTGNTESTKSFQLHNDMGSLTMEIAPSVASMMIDVGENIPFSSLYSGDTLNVEKTTDYLMSLRVKHLQSTGASSNVAELNKLNNELGVSTLKKRLLGLSYLGSQFLTKSVPDIKLCHDFEARTNEVTKCSLTVQYTRLSALCELGFFVKDSASISQASTILANPAFSQAISAYLKDMENNSTMTATSSSSSEQESGTGTTEIGSSVSSGGIQGELIVYNANALKSDLSNIENADGLTAAEILEFSEDVVNVTAQYYYDRYSRIFAEICEDTLGLLQPFGECLSKTDTFKKYNGTMWAKAFTYDYCGAYDSASSSFKANLFHLQIPQSTEIQPIYVPPATVSAMLKKEKTESFDSLMNSDGSANGGKTGEFLIDMGGSVALKKRLFGLGSLSGVSSLPLTTSCTTTCEAVKNKGNSTISNCWGQATINVAYRACMSVCEHFDSDDYDD